MGKIKQVIKQITCKHEMSKPVKRELIRNLFPHLEGYESECGKCGKREIK